MANRIRDNLDLLPHITQIIHDAIQDGLIRGVKLKRFRTKIKTLTGPALEDYLQDLWDKFPPDYSKKAD